MDEPQLALRLLITKDRAEAESLAAQLEKLNASRKGVVAGIVREAKKHVKARFVESDRVVVLAIPTGSRRSSDSRPIRSWARAEASYASGGETRTAN